ncbi:hypothetical protein MSAN_01641300 [Mycena sanguinolenta]|uniref:Uncharacterized protein n=1 Tax=Mycena sanguinolenta TaxID=230812 RepID=A0A8H6Y2V3_9AGAR|nr:hypothetical protein MSAN_01641300 [Mycena sanguinolenta]
MATLVSSFSADFEKQAAADSGAQAEVFADCSSQCGWIMILGATIQVILFPRFVQITLRSLPTWQATTRA